MIERYGITAYYLLPIVEFIWKLAYLMTLRLQMELLGVGLSVQKLANGSCPYLLVNNIFSVGPSNCEADYYINGTKLPQCVMPRSWRYNCI